MSKAAAGNRTPPRAEKPSLTPHANLLKFSFFNATTWMIALGTPLVLLAGELGASSFEVGLIYAFVFLLLPVQILATSTLPRFGYKRQIIFAWVTRGAFIGIIGGLAPIIWGFLVRVPGSRPGVQSDVFALYFLALLVSQLILLAYIPRLTSAHRERPSLQVSANLIRPFRYLGHLVNVIPEKKDP